MADKTEPRVRESGTFTGVEHSDGRLAAAEEAKRTGLEFRSTGAEGVDIVPYTVAVEAGNEWSNQLMAEQSELGDALAAGTKEVSDLNEKKAKAHESYSEGVIRRRADRKEMSVGERVQAIVKRNEEIAKQHEDLSNAVAGRANIERVPLRAEQVDNDEPVTLLGQQAVKDSVTNISESEEREMFKDKGRVAYGEVPFEAFVDESTSAKENRAEERDVPIPHKAGELSGDGSANVKQNNEPEQKDNADKEAREQKKAQEKARREEQKRQREEAEKAAAAAEAEKNENSGESQE